MNVHSPKNQFNLHDVSWLYRFLKKQIQRFAFCFFLKSLIFHTSFPKLVKNRFDNQLCQKTAKRRQNTHLTCNKFHWFNNVQPTYDTMKPLSRVHKGNRTENYEVSDFFAKISVKLPPERTNDQPIEAS